MTHAYSPLYLEDAMHNLGSMLDYAINHAHFKADIFFEMFVASGVAAQMEAGNPRYVSGMSGVELTLRVLAKSSDYALPPTTYCPHARTPEYWAGWVLAYYQWHSTCSFVFIQRNGLNISTIISLYPRLHEADLSKFVQTANRLIQKHLSTRRSTLKTIRKQAHFTQKQLADLSGVTLRMIQAYEQGDQDIRKAEAKTVIALSQILGCTPETICL